MKNAECRRPDYAGVELPFRLILHSSFFLLHSPFPSAREGPYPLLLETQRLQCPRWRAGATRGQGRPRSPGPVHPAESLLREENDAGVPDRHGDLPLPPQCQDQPQLRGLHRHRLPGRHHPAYPGPGAQMVRYYGWYSNKMRGVRHRGLPSELVPYRPGVSPPPPVKLPSKKWRDLILRVWHVAPLRSIHKSSFIIHPFRHLPFPRFGLRTRETGRLLGQEWLKIDKIWLLTARVAFNTVAPCSLSPETNSPSPAQR